MRKKNYMKIFLRRKNLMEKDKERNNIWLFDNDLMEYQVSDEGKIIAGMLTYNDNDYHIRKSKISKKQLQEAFDNYWEARNYSDDGLHYSNTKELKEAKQSDQSYAEAYREQN